MGFFTNILLRIRTKSGWTTKGSNLSNTEVDDNFIAIADEINARDIQGSFQSWETGTTQAGQVRIYTSKLWLCLTTTTVAPSESSANWQRINVSATAHMRNTDVKLAEGTSNEVTATTLRALVNRIKITSTGYILKAPGNTLDTPQVNDLEFKYVSGVWEQILHT